MTVAESIKEKLGDEWLPALYELKVRSQRTRAHTLEIPKRENARRHSAHASRHRN